MISLPASANCASPPATAPSAISAQQGPRWLQGRSRRDERQSLLIAVLAVCAAVFVRFVWLSCDFGTPQVADLAGSGCRLHLACSDGAAETLVCGDELFPSVFVPLAPEHWAFGALIAPDCKKRPFDPSMRLEAGGMSQAMRWALGEPIELMRCDAATLALVPGMTPVLARRVVNLRSAAGSISTYKSLAAIDGIGSGRLKNLAEHSVLVSEPKLAFLWRAPGTASAFQSDGFPRRARR